MNGGEDIRLSRQPSRQPRLSGPISRLKQNIDHHIADDTCALLAEETLAHRGAALAYDAAPLRS